MNYKINEAVWILPRRLKGIVKEIENNKYKVTYFLNNERKTEWFEEKQLTKFKKSLPIKIKYFDKDIPKIEKIKVGNWIDLRAAKDVVLKQFEYALIPLGVAMQLPRGFEANIAPRSSTFKNFGILQTNHFGVVDNSYCGNNDQWFFPALAMRDTEIKKGDRICQFRINRVMPKVQFIEVETLENEDRGGHGSTGTN